MFNNDFRHFPHLPLFLFVRFPFRRYSSVRCPIIFSVTEPYAAHRRTYIHAHFFTLTELCLLCVRSFDSPLVQCCRQQSHPWPSLNNNFIFSLLLFIVLISDLLFLLLLYSLARVYFVSPLLPKNSYSAKTFVARRHYFFIISAQTESNLRYS